MIYPTPHYSSEDIDLAGKRLVEGQFWANDYHQTLAVVNNWRSSHQFPLNTFAVTLRQYARDVADAPLIAQRTKRLESIRLKLQRFDWLPLSRMQDLGGCRAVVSDVFQVDDLVKRYKEKSRIKHLLADEDDYIRNPKKTGYRGYHLIYAYNSDKKPTYNGLQIEMQLRTLEMHAWATAVETVDTFTKEGLKSGKGKAEWRRFFALMSQYFALLEGSPPVPDIPQEPLQLLADIREHEARLDVISRLTAYGQALQAVQDPVAPKEGHYYLLVLEAEQKRLSVYSFKQSDVKDAEYHQQEYERQGHDVVLVSVDSMEALYKAYPNYFLDTKYFLNMVSEAIRQ